MTISSQTESMLTHAKNMLTDKNNIVIKVESLTQLTIQAPVQGNIVIKGGEGITAVKNLNFVRHGDNLTIFTEDGHHPVVVIEGYYAQEQLSDIYGIDDKDQLYTWSGANSTSQVSALSDGESSVEQAVPAQDSSALAEETQSAAAEQQDNDNDKGAAGLFGMSGWAAAAAGIATAAVAGGVIAASRHGSHTSGDNGDSSSSEASSHPDSATHVQLTDEKGNDIITSSTVNEKSHLLISGQATPECSVIIKDGDNVLGTAPVDENGHWDLPLALKSGAHQITTQVTDNSGNTSDPTAPISIDVDLTPPDAAHDITLSSKDGNILEGTTTNSSTPTIHGKAEPGTTVTLKEGDKVIGSAEVDQNGDWQIIPADALAEGENNLTVEVTDNAGNRTSSALDVTVDTIPPSGTLSDIQIISGNNPDDLHPVTSGLTNDSTPALSGAVEGAEAGDRVVIKEGGVVIGCSDIDNDGHWSFTPTSPLGEGSHHLSAELQDSAGNVGDARPVDVTVDTTAPDAAQAITVSDKDGNDLDGTATNSSTPTIHGKAEPGTTVTLKEGDKVIGSAEVDQNGDWQITPADALAEGENNLTVEVTDNAGNSTTSDLAVTVDTTPPGGTTSVTITSDAGKLVDAAHPTNDTTPTLSGHVEGAQPGDRIVIRDGNTVLGTASIADDGSWTFTPPNALIDGSHSITATVTDAVGNAGTPSAATDYIQNTVKPNAATDIHVTNDVTNTEVPANGITNDTTPTLSGKATAGSTINILDKDGNILTTVQADDKGEWQTSVPVLADGLYDALQVQVVDNAGNHAETSVPAFTVDTVNHNTTSIESTSGKADATPTFNGQVILADGDTYQTVTVTIKDDNGAVIASNIPVNADGSWSFTPDDEHPLTPGVHHISAVVVDSADNESQLGYLNGSSDGSMTIIPSEPVVISSSAKEGGADTFGYSIAASDNYIYISAPRAGTNANGGANYQGVIYAISKNYAHLITQSCDIETLLGNHPEMGIIIQNNSAVHNANGDNSDLEGYGLKALDGGWVAIYSHWNDKVFFIKEPLPQNLDLKDISNAPDGYNEHGFMITDNDWARYFAFNVGSIANKDGTLTFLIGDIASARGEHGAITTVTFDPANGKWGNITLKADPANGTEHAGWVPESNLPEGMSVGHIDHEDRTTTGTTQNNNLGSDIQMLGDILGDGHQYLAIQDAESARLGLNGRGTWYLYQVPETGMPANLSLADVDTSQMIRINNIGSGYLNEINYRPTPDGGGAEQLPHTHNIANLGGFSNDTDTDIAIGSSTDNYKSTNGKVWILHANKLDGNINIGVNDQSQSFDTKYGYAIVSTNHGGGQGFGLNVIGGYDFNGDSIKDLVISDPNAKDPNGNTTGAVYVVYGGHEADYQGYLASNNGQIDIQDILDKGWGEVHYGSVNNQLFGWSVDVVDMNGDGRPDLIVGAPSSTTGDSNSDLYNGQVYVIYNTHDDQPAPHAIDTFAANSDTDMVNYDDTGAALLLDGDHQNIDLANLTSALKGHHNVDMSDGNNTLKMDNRTLDAIASENNEESTPLIVTGENGNVELGGGAENWHSNGTVTVDGTVYQEFQSSGQSEVLIEDRVHVTIL